MKKRMCVFLLLIIGISMWNFFISNSIASTSIYVPSDDPTDPFIITTETSYLISGGEFEIDGIATYYHQVFIDSYKLYGFIWGAGMDQFNFELTKEDGSITVFQTFQEEWDSNVMLFEVSESGIYNLTIEQPDNVVGSSGFDGMGVFSIPELVLGETLNTPWTFDGIMWTIAYYDFQAKGYEQGCCIQSKYFRWDDLPLGGGAQSINIDSTTHEEFSGDSITTINTEGRYIIYIYGTRILPIDEYQELVDAPPFIFIPGFNAFVFPAILLGIAFAAKKIKTKF